MVNNESTVIDMNSNYNKTENYSDNTNLMNDEESKIVSFYSNQTVLITGATGFCGKLLLFKLLKTMLNINKIFILIRAKTGKNATERLQDLIDKSYGMFDSINVIQMKKLVAVDGDISKPELGLSDNDKNILMNEVTIVFHSAADVRFMVNLRKQLTVNVGGTNNVMILCEQMKNLKAFIHVSTAYSNPNRKLIEEKVYESRINPLDLLENIDKITDENTSYYLEDFINTYTFSKHLAESVVAKRFCSFPVAIVRPGTVFSPIRDPMCGWMDSMTGFNFFYITIAMGIKRVSRYDKKLARLDCIPGDIVANACIVAAYVTAVKYPTELRVYNVNTSSIEGSLTCHEYRKILWRVVNKYPFAKAIRPIAKPEKQWQMNNRIVSRLVMHLTETSFAYLMDFLSLIRGKERSSVKNLKKIQLVHELLSDFSDLHLQFKNDNFFELGSYLEGSDKKTFDINVKDIDWNEYVLNTHLGSKAIYFKESEADTIKAKKRIKLVNYGLNVFYILLIALLLFFVFNYYIRPFIIGLYYH